MVEQALDRLNLEERSLKLAVLTLALYGSYRLAKGLKSASWSLLKYFVLPRKDLATRYGKGSWVIATGGADGLGKQYCC